MKTFTIVFLFCLALSFPASAQPEQSLQKGPVPDIYPISVPNNLQEKWQRNLIPLKSFKEANKQSSMSLSKISAWGFTVGYADSLWATNMNPSDPNHDTEYRVLCHCRAVGSNCYIFVEDSLWTNGTVTLNAVDSIRTAWETRTPGNSTKGVFQLDTTYFGTPPDVDDDPKIIILILDIKDGFSGSGGFVAGYFHPYNEYPDALVQYYIGPNNHSNEAEIFYIDANPCNLKISYYLNMATSTTAHEFQHMIHWWADGDEETFVNEGMSESASVLCGFGLRSPSLYYANTNVDFLSWKLTSDVLRDYSRAALFSWYLVEQFGSPLTKLIVQDTSNGIKSYNNAFTALGSPLDFHDALKNFAVAISLNDISVDPQYGFTISVPGSPLADTYTSTVVPTVTDTVQPYGTQYIKFTGGDSLSFTVNYSGSLEVKAIALGSGPTRVDYITSGTPYNLSEFGTNYSNVIVAVTELIGTPVIFTYTASRITTGVADESKLDNNPKSFALGQNYPNPFNPSTSINYQLPSKGFVSLKVYDLMGREVATLSDGIKDAGTYTLRWNANNLSSGVYYYRLTTEKFTQTNKMLLLK